MKIQLDIPFIAHGSSSSTDFLNFINKTHNLKLQCFDLNPRYNNCYMVVYEYGKVPSIEKIAIMLYDFETTVGHSMHGTLSFFDKKNKEHSFTKEQIIALKEKEVLQKTKKTVKAKIRTL